MYINKNLIEVSLGKRPAELVVKGGKLINVFTREIYPADVAIAEQRIAAIGDVDYCIGENTQIIDAGGRYLSPGLIDSHFHPEVCKITLTRLANWIVPRGTTSIMAPLDQIGVVTGLEGMRFVLDEVKRTPLKIFHSCPSRLPYTTPASTIAHHFAPAEHEIGQKWPEAVGIWEYMASSIEDLDQKVLDAAEIAFKNRHLPHGHMPVVFGKILSACAAAGTADDHESYTAEEMIEKLSNGIAGLIRRGTHSDNVPLLIKAITEKGIPTSHLAFCTDDLDCTDLVELGLIDYIVRYAIRLGVDPVTAIQMGSLNAAKIYRVDHLVGSIAPGRMADIVLLRDLPTFDVEAVIANGKLVARDGNMLDPIPSPKYPENFYNTVKLDQPIQAGQLQIEAKEDAKKARVLCIHLDLDEGLLSKGREVILPVADGKILCDPSQGINNIAITERHTGKGKTNSAFISGFDLKKGAIATSLSPDDDNIICIGANPEDMAFAINRLAQLGGGQIAVAEGKILAEAPLPLCGLMADIPVDEMATTEQRLNEAAHQLGTPLKRPFFFMIFLSITAIPDYAMTDAGMVEFATRSVIDPVLGLDK